MNEFILGCLFGGGLASLAFAGLVLYAAIVVGSRADDRMGAT